MPRNANPIARSFSDAGRLRWPAAICATAMLMAACGGGDGSNGINGTNGTDGIDGANALVRVSGEAAGSHCAAGGTRIDAGTDANGNGTLDDSEVSSTQFVCSGAAGVAGNTGATGAAGAKALVKTDTSVDTHCSVGGTRVLAGTDSNGNGTLDDAEVTSTAYVCNGTAGATGATGAAGATGATGTAGIDSLIASTAEPAGATCAAGGTMITSGLDTNRNGTLDPSEVSATSYVCNAPASGLPWTSVSGAGIQADPNNGYLASDASAAVAITLPTSPAVGDIVKVFGAGAGGWTIAQNAGQSVQLAGSGITTGPGAAWAPAGPTGIWTGVAFSSDGTKLVGAQLLGQLYTSTDGGATWTPRDATRQWFAVASSADGTKLVAGDTDGGNGGQLYTSTDSGVTWTPRDSNRNWHGVASSTDGSKLVAADFGVTGGSLGFLYTSTDSGVTWTPRGAARGWTTVASSTDGTKLVAAAVSDQIYTSTDSGVTWTARAFAANWTSVAASADGAMLVAAEAGSSSGHLYTSTDGGVTWTPRLAGDWSRVTSSADGVTLMAASNLGGSNAALYVSTNGGVTWTARSPLATQLYSIAVSADGRTQAAGSGASMYISHAQTLSTTTPGIGGGLSGAIGTSAELIYLGNGTFGLSDSFGTIHGQ